MKSARIVFIVMVLCGFFTTAFAQGPATDRNWDLVVDSIFQDQGILMPEGVPPTSSFTEIDCRRGLYVVDSDGLLVNADSAFTIYQEVCSGSLARIRFVDVRDNHPKRILLIAAFSQTELTCELWPNEGFWNGGEPSDTFLPSFVENECENNKSKFSRLLRNLMH